MGRGQNSAPTPAAAAFGRVGGREGAAGYANAASDPQGDLSPTLKQTRLPPGNPLRSKGMESQLILEQRGCKPVCDPFASPFPLQENFGVYHLGYLRREMFVSDSHFMPASLRSCVGATKIG